MLCETSFITDNLNFSLFPEHTHKLYSKVIVVEGVLVLVVVLQLKN